MRFGFEPSNFGFGHCGLVIYESKFPDTRGTEVENIGLIRRGAQDTVGRRLVFAHFLFLLPPPGKNPPLAPWLLLQNVCLNQDGNHVQAIQQAGARLFDHRTMALVTAKDRAFAVCPPSMLREESLALSKNCPDFRLGGCRSPPPTSTLPSLSALRKEGGVSTWYNVSIFNTHSV